MSEETAREIVKKHIHHPFRLGYATNGLTCWECDALVKDIAATLQVVENHWRREHEDLQRTLARARTAEGALQLAINAHDAFNSPGCSGCWFPYDVIRTVLEKSSE